MRLKKCNQHYAINHNTSCSKYANRYSILENFVISFIFLSCALNHAVDFVEMCNVCARKAIIEAAKRIIISDKMCCSYSNLNFGVTFLEHSVYIRYPARKRPNESSKIN